jgi:membrane fusion protein (multidrug efflux system)
MAKENEVKGSIARRIRAYLLLALVVLALVTFGYKWYQNYSKYEKTDDAYIDADRVSVSSKMLGRIAAAYVAEGDTVVKGQLLVELDSTDLIAQKVQAAAAIEQARAAANQALAKYALDQKTIRVQEVALERAKEDLDRATLQLNGNVITKEQFDHIKKAYETSLAQLEVINAQVVVSKSMIESAQQTVSLSSTQLNTVQTQLKNTQIYAPVSGRIAKRWLLPGDIAQPGQSVFTITKNDSMYVTAFFEETKIAELFVGKKIEFTVDAYPGVIFNGLITYIASNTAAQFSLIPPNNASGNFTKVSQRIPIRMSILGSDNNGKYKNLQLAAGMSVYVKIPR